MATDPVIKDHQLWIGFAQPEGLVVSPHALKNAQAVLSRNVGAQQEIIRRHVVPDLDGNLRLKDFPAFTQEFWGWRESDLATPPDDLFARLPEYGETLRPTWVVRGGKGQPENLILAEELPRRTDFDKPGPTSEEQHWHASPQSRFERLLRDTGVSIGLLISPERIRLVYAPKGESSGHVTFPIHQMTMAANWPMLAALHLLLHSDRLFIGPENQRLPAILEASRRYQNEVSIRLAGQVLRALNELVRGFQEADRAAHGNILREALRHDPNHIYGGMLTTLMRMVFVLYAEDRSLMGSDETWLQNYSISGMYERLRADAGQYPDTMDSRYGAWAQIVTLTRLLYDGGGHGSWRLPPRHGGLFDPDAYSFLEGRAWASARSATVLVEPPLVSDGILFRILQDLLYLDGERISYRALDVEQIGSVYEAMMGFTVETAHGISIGLGSDHLVIDLEDLLSKKPADRAKWLKENADCEVTGKAIEQLNSAASVDELLAALRRRISKLYLDQNANPVTVPADGIYLQPTEERRRSGSHYTPRSLTQPIVKTTLDPVLARLGDNPTPEQILGLKVCDPAMGSGAFLVEACRYLGEKLEKAWNAHRLMPAIPVDQDPLLHARRIVAQRCLYGVDKNPFAVNLAKLSLWLATFAKDHPFTFVDHTLRCGDSLVGLTAHQIEAFHWQPKEEGALLRDLPSRLRHILNARAQILDAADETPYEILAQKLAVTEEQMIDIRLAGDLTIAAFFGADKPKDRETWRKDLADKFRRAQERVTDLGLEDELRNAIRAVKRGHKGLTPFHWHIEFPEVFTADLPGGLSGGFDSIVGNPPFLGGSRISTLFGMCYFSYLTSSYPPAGHQCDLVGYFFRRAFSLLKEGGTLGFIATKTIAQGDTRNGALFPILTNGGHIYNAETRLKWPGAAAVIVSRLHISKRFDPPSVLDGKPVHRISAYLVAGFVDAPPEKLSTNPYFSKGSQIYGQGFVFDDSDAKANKTALMHDIISADPTAQSRIFPFIGGEELNSQPVLLPNAHVIYLSDLKDESELAAFPDLARVVRDRVKPERDILGDNPNNAPLKKRWWAYQAHRPELYERLKRRSRALAHAEISAHLGFQFVPPGWIYNKTMIVIDLDTFAAFAVLQSRIHESWVHLTASTLKDDLGYRASDCFQTFPFPRAFELSRLLNDVGAEMYNFRATLMVRNNEGLTKTYNRFHDPDEHSSDILHLRELQATVDRAVLDAYAWDDLSDRGACEFLLDYEDEAEDVEGPSGRRSRKKPWRFRWPDDFRDRVLTRLLDLNQKQAEEEVATTAPTAKPGVSRRGKRPPPAVPSYQHRLEYEEPTE